ncbi:unnamed protein product [Penicillium glandicola]
MSLSSGSSSRSTATSAERKGLPCQQCFRRMKQHPNHLPDAVRADAIEALTARPARRRAALIKAVQRPRKSTYGYSDMDIHPISTGSSGAADVPPCPRFYHTPMTNDLRNQDMKTIEAVRDEVQTVLNRTTWEVEKLTEHLNELATEEAQEDLSAWV